MDVNLYHQHQCISFLSQCLSTTKQVTTRPYNLAVYHGCDKDTDIAAILTGKEGHRLGDDTRNSHKIFCNLFISLRKDGKKISIIIIGTISFVKMYNFSIPVLIIVVVYRSWFKSKTFLAFSNDSHLTCNNSRKQIQLLISSFYSFLCSFRSLQYDSRIAQSSWDVTALAYATNRTS